MKTISAFPLLAAIALMQCVTSLCLAQTIVPANVQGITSGASDGIDHVDVDFNQSQTTLTKQTDGSYVLVTPNGTVHLYDFVYLYFKDAAVVLDVAPTERTVFDLQGNESNTFIDDNTFNTLFVYYGGDDVYSGNVGNDAFSVDFNQSQTTLTKQTDGSYVLVTPNGTVHLYDFVYLYFKDAAVALDAVLTIRTFFDQPGDDNTFIGDDGTSSLFVYYGGNDTYVGNGGEDAVSVAFNQSQTTPTKQLDGSYVLVSPNGTIRLYDFKRVYFQDATITLDDIDNDGILDIHETNTGVYNSPTDTGTDPNNPDTDGDGLLDGVETNTGIYISPSDTGTNPNTADIDNDGLKDGAESLLKSLGFDPNINNSESVISLFANPNNAFLYTQSQHNANRTTGQQDVINNPMSYGLYTSDSIMDLRMGGLMIQKIGTNAVVSFQPQTTTDLNLPFTNNGTPITNTIPMPGNKGFIRINAKP